MQEHIEQRLRPVVHTPAEQALIARVNRIRELSACIMIEAAMGPTQITSHERIGTPEQRASSTFAAAMEINELMRAFYPNQLVLAPPAGLKFLP